MSYWQDVISVFFNENNNINESKPEGSCSGGVWGGRKALRPGIFSHDHKMIVTDMRTMEISEISLPLNPLKPTFILHKHKHKIANKKQVKTWPRSSGNKNKNKQCSNKKEQKTSLSANRRN